MVMLDLELGSGADNWEWDNVQSMRGGDAIDMNEVHQGGGWHSVSLRQEASVLS